MKIHHYITKSKEEYLKYIKFPDKKNLENFKKSDKNDVLDESAKIFFKKKLIKIIYNFLLLIK